MKTINSLTTLLLLLTLWVEPISAQDEKENSRQVFKIVEEMPEFQGGQQALREFIVKNVKYPESAKERGVQGQVFVSFVIDEVGKVTNSKILRSVDPLLDAEALRVINLMPAWKPGKQRGKAVKVEFVLPVSFALDGADKPGDETVTVKFSGNSMNLSGNIELIEKMRHYLQHGKPETFIGKDSAILNFYFSDETPDDPVFFIVEEMPEFPGGEAALRKNIANNIRYPIEAMKDSIQGKVYVTFIVSKDGSVKGSRIARGVHPLLDEEALRVVEGLPQWVPGRQRGEAVNVSYTVPINFVLQ